MLEFLLFFGIISIGFFFLNKKIKTEKKENFEDREN